MVYVLNQNRQSDFVDGFCPDIHGQENLWTYMGSYIKHGFSCLFNLQKDHQCRFASLYLVLYSGSQFAIQRILTQLVLMSPKGQKQVNFIFSYMVLFTLLAFLLGFVVLGIQNQIQPSIIDIISVLICAAGVFIHNRIPKKKRNVCITHN